MLTSTVANRSKVGNGPLLRYYRIHRAVLAVLQPIGRTEPDLDLIKQAEQVTISVLEGPARRFAGILSVGVADAV
jgi:hypothetical protein